MHGMSPPNEGPAVGDRLVGADGRHIDAVDAVLADYLLVRTAGLLPVDLYVPRPEVSVEGARLGVAATAADAYRRWHLPLKRAPHD